jgi:hypothetical protein
MLSGKVTNTGSKGLGGGLPGNFHQGVQGPIGKTPELSIGEVETLPPEAEATVEIAGTKEKEVSKSALLEWGKYDG